MEYTSAQALRMAVMFVSTSRGFRPLTETCNSVMIVGERHGIMWYASFSSGFCDPHDVIQRTRCGCCVILNLKCKLHELPDNCA